MFYLLVVIILNLDDLIILPADVLLEQGLNEQRIEFITIRKENFTIRSRVVQLFTVLVEKNHQIVKSVLNERHVLFLRFNQEFFK